MRYISDDGKVFDTEQACCEHEQEIERLKNEERIKRENLEFKRKELMDAICQTRKDLRELTELYQIKFGVVIGEYLPVSEFLKILYGC